MNRIYGIIAEFNPFHNGHAALVQAAGERGAEGVVVVMSGNFVQRGSAAVTDKRVRAKAALLCGVDLVLELPVAFAAAPAQRFARGAVEVLQGSGCVNGLIFGSECGEVAELRMLADTLDHPGLAPLIRTRLRAGVTFARAREQAVAELLGPQRARALASPNNTLAVEYLRAAKSAGWRPETATLRRLGAGHDADDAEGIYAPASYLRSRASDFALQYRHMPQPAAGVLADAYGAGLYPADPARLEVAVLAHLRRMGMDELCALPDLSEGLENRLWSAIRQAATIEGLERALKTKRYTMARIRRLVLSAFLGVTREDVRAPVPYLRVLGFTPRGREILGEMKRTARLPVSQSLARLRALGGTCERFAALEELATDLYALALPRPPACGYEYSASAVFFK